MSKDKELRISIKIDADSNAVKLTKKEVAELNKGFTNTSSSIGTMTKGLAGIAASLGGLYALSELLQEVYTSGIEYNRTLENLTNGLTTLNVVTASNISSTGQYLTLQDKYRIATDEATESVRRLTEINQTTPHTLAQTVEIYKAMYPSMRKVGISSEQLYDITQKMSIAAGSAGIEFQQLLAGVDGLASGSVLANSELGRFLNSLGLTNDELKNADDLYALINSKLKDVQAIETYDTAISNLGNSFDQLAGSITEPFFEEIKDWAKDATKLFNTMLTGVKNLKLEFSSVSDLNEVDDLRSKITLLNKENAEFFEKQGTYGRDYTKDIKANNIQLEEARVKLSKILLAQRKAGNLTPKGIDTSGIDALVHTTLNPYANGIEKINEKWESSFNLLSTNGKDTSSLVKAWTKELDDYDTKFNKKSTSKTTEEPTYTNDAHVTEYYKQKREAEAELQEMYRKSSMTSYEYERDSLQKKYDEHKTYTDSIAMLDAWYSTELQKVNDAEYEEYKKLQEKKRQEHGSFQEGAVDALNTYQAQAANAYSQGETLFTSAMSSMEDAILDFVTTGKLSFSDLLNSIAKMVIQQQVVSPLAGALSGFIGNMFSSSASSISTLGEFNLLTRADGGIIPTAKYASGGLLSGGSGFKDDLYLGSASGSHVFAMGGEYIVNKDAVNSLGVSTMDYINKNGQIPSTGASVVSSKTEIILNNNSGIPMETSLLSQSSTSDKKGQALEMLELQMDLISRNEKNSKKFFKGIAAS